MTHEVGDDTQTDFPDPEVRRADQGGQEEVAHSLLQHETTHVFVTAHVPQLTKLVL